jgi:DNA-binding XRE family transcriptional regulator
MRKTGLRHVNRRLSDEERERHARIRELAVRDIPPRADAGGKPCPPGIPAQVRATRERQGLTWYALAKLAGIPNQASIRDIEQGKDVKLSTLRAVVAALGLTLELAEAQRLPRR